MAEMISPNCAVLEHSCCDGHAMDNRPCDCGCHPGSKGEREAGVIRDPVNGWALRCD